MAPPHIPIASRLESARRQRVSGLGYDAVIKGARSPLIGAAGRPASGPGKAPCRFPGGTAQPHPRKCGRAGLLSQMQDAAESKPGPGTRLADLAPHRAAR